MQIAFNGNVGVGIRLQPDMSVGPVGIALPLDFYFTSNRAEINCGVGARRHRDGAGFINRRGTYVGKGQ